MTLSTEIDSDFIAKAARLIYFGLETRKNFIQEREFKELIQDYKGNSTFYYTVQAIAEGMRLEILNIDISGVFLRPYQDSIFSLKKSKVKGFLKRNEDKYIGLILLGIAAYFFPTDTTFDEESIHFTRPLTVTKLEAFLTEKCSLIKRKERSEGIDIEDGLMETLVTSYLQLPNEKEERSSKINTKEGMIRKTFRFLNEEGLFLIRGDNYFLTPKFRFQMEDMSRNDTLLEFLEKTKRTG